MKLWLKILLSFVGTLIAIVLAIIIFQDAIIRYSLQKAIKWQSNGEIELVIEKLDFSYNSQSVELIKPEVKFADAWLDTAKTVQFKKLVFDRIYVDSLKLIELIRDNLIIADQFIVDKPGIYFVEKGGPEQSSFQPEELFQAMSSDTSESKMIDIRIRDIEINYGSINVESIAASEYPPELVDFTIVLKNFNTNPSPDIKKNQVLFSEDLFIEIQDLQKFMVAGYLLDIGYARFSSKDQKFKVNNVELTPIDDFYQHKSQIALKSDSVVLNGINLEEVRGLESLVLESLVIAGGYLNFYPVSEQFKQNQKSKKPGLSQLGNIIHQFELDTLAIASFAFHHIPEDRDTLVSVEDIHFVMHGIQLDSNIIIDPVKYSRFSEFMLRTGNFKTRIEEEGFSISHQDFTYSTSSEELILSGLQLSPLISTSINPLDIKLAELRINGLDPARIQTGKKLSLKIDINSPDAHIDLLNSIFKPSAKESGKGFPKDLFEISRFSVNDGNIFLTKGDDLHLSVKQIEGFAEDLAPENNFIPNLESLLLKSGSINISIPGSVKNFNVKSFEYGKNDLILNKVYTELISGKDDLTILNTDKITMSGFHADSLVYHHTISARSFQVDSPDITGNFRLPDKKLSDSSTGSENKQSKPISINLDAIIVNKGASNIVLINGTERFRIKTTFETSMSDLQLSTNADFEEILDNIKPRISLTDVQLGFTGHIASMETMNLDLLLGNMELANLSIQAGKGSSEQLYPYVIPEFHLQSLKIVGFDHSSIIKDEKLIFKSIDLRQLDGTIRLSPGPKKENGNKDGEAYTQIISDFEYEYIKLSDINLQTIIQNDSTNVQYRLKNFHFKHNKIADLDDNLVNDLILHADRLDFSDSINKSFAVIEGLNLNPEGSSLSIDFVDGGNTLKNFDEGLKRKPEPKTKYYLKGLSLEGIKLRDEFPTRLSIDKLGVDNLDLTITQDRQKASKPGLKFDIDFLRKWNFLMTSLNVDTSEVKDMRIWYRSSTDTASQLVWADSMGLLINKIKFDTTMFGQEDPNIISNISVAFKNRALISADSLYEIESGTWHYSFPERKITIDTLLVIPRYESEEFFDRSVYQTDRMEVECTQIVLNDFRLQEMVEDNHIHFGSVDLHDLNLTMIRDLKYPRKPNDPKKMPVESLMSIQQKFTVDSLMIHDSFLSYSEISPKSIVPGEVVLDRVNLIARNITNDIENLDSNSFLKANLSAYIMRDARLEIAVYFPLLSKRDEFWLSAVSETIDLTKLSDLTTHVMGLAILRGKGSINASGIHGIDSVATGQMMFRYKKVRLALYNQKKDKLNTGFGVNFMNFMINDLALKSNNPPLLRKARVGQVYFVRDNQKSAVNYLWKSLMSGMLSTMGFNNKAQRQERREMKKDGTSIE